MKRTIKKLLSVILVLTMLVTVGSIGTLIVEASANHSQAEAVEWIKARGNERWWEDVDGAYGCQCVDLILKYYRYLVGYNVSGNAKDYAWNSLPSGWYRDTNPTPGCIYYSTSGEYGHIGLVYAVSGSTLYTVETNTGSPYDGGSNSFARFHTRTTANASGYIHPDFPVPHTHSYGAWQTVKAATCTASGSKKRVCSCGDTQTETIPATGHSWNSGAVTKQPTCDNKGVKTYTCSSCGATRTEDIAALGHLYEAVTVPATCTEDAYTRFTCSRCGNTYTEAIDGWSEWTTTPPPANAKDTQQKTQYRYRTKETDSGTDPEKTGWTTDGETWKQTSSGTHVYFPRPSGFNNSAYTNYASSALSSSSNATTKRDVLSSSHKSYIYWHWAFPYTKGVGTNTIIGDYYGDTYSGYPDSATVWEAFENASDLTEYSYSDSCVRVQGHSSYSYNWFKTEVYQQTYIDYVKQYSYYRWSDWSAWQDDSITGSSDKQIEQRTVYRYLSDDNNATGHQFGTTWKYNAQSHWQECSVCGVKSESGSHVFDNDKDATCNTCGYTRTVEVDPVIDPDDAHLVIGSKTARVGDTVKISLVLKNAPQLKSIAISDITYDSSALELTNAGWKLSDSILNNWNPSNQTAAIAFAKNKDVNGSILELTFKVKNGAKDGDYPIGCKITAKVKKLSGAEEPVAISTTRGTIRISNGISRIVDGYYYVNGFLTKGAGLVELNGAIYFVKNDGSVYTNGTLKVVESKTNGLVAAGSYSFDKNGKLIDVKKIVKGYYYVNGKKAPGAGVVEYNGNFYFVTNNASVYTSGRLAVAAAKTNGLLPAAAYNFDENGKLLCNGLINGYFYIDGDKAKGAGIVEYAGNLYFARNDASVYKNGKLAVPEAKTNGLIPAGAYNFDEDGKMADVKRIVKGYYYVNGKKAPGAGLIEYNGDFYFVTNNASVYTSGYLYVTKAKANKLVLEGRYQFDSSGKMIK